MDGNYIITSSGAFVNVDEFYHHGILGMKWGVRRYQNADGSLTAAGRKRYANPDGSLNEKGKKKFGDSVTTVKKVDTAESSSKQPSVSDMTDAELQARVNRLNNEFNYKRLNKELGYDGPKTELDAKIAEMEKQKRYLELQRDIKNLTPEKVSKGKKFVDTVVDKVVAPAATEAGKKLLTQYLTEAGTKAVGKKLKEETDKIDKTVKKSTERVKEKEAKKQAKEEAKAEKQSAKGERADQTKSKNSSDDNKVYTGKVEKTGNSSKKSSTSESSSSKITKEIIDLKLNSDGVYEYSNVGRSWVSGYLSSGKDDD